MDAKSFVKYVVTSDTTTFPITFPNAALDLYATLSGVNVKAYALLPIFVDGYDASTAAAGVNGVQPTGIQQVTWLAIGY